MGISLVVAVTDGGWFKTLRACPSISEVNFWSPSGNNFKALRPGELFLFKLHAPDNVIAGGGVFAHASVMPCSLAWEAFGPANGAHSLIEMRKRIIPYRKADPSDRSDFPIGCRILTQPFFLEERDWIPVPESWAPNIVTFKRYDTSDAEGLRLWESVMGQLAAQRALDPETEGARFGAPQVIHPRLGQGAFRAVVTDNYGRRCAVTSERTLPVLEAAHIRPYSVGGTHDPRNGLLLRSDVHTLFDRGYVTVTPNLEFEVSRRIREEFENGKEYYDLQGTRIVAPSDFANRPDAEALAWHNENCFL